MRFGYRYPACIDPEYVFAMTLASCHLLTFLALVSKKGFIVDRYTDGASGELGKNAAGGTAMVKVPLRPEVVFGGTRIPTAMEFDKLQEQAHKGCFIANSLARCVEVVIEPRMLHGGE